MENDVDAVLAWVDGSDPMLKAKQRLYFVHGAISEQIDETRFASCNEILYSVGALLRFAPFLRKIFIVTDAQTPPIFERLALEFGSEAVKKIEIVDHTVIFRGYEDVLPVFNSISIASMIHRIPGLAENFVYLNDDIFLVRPASPEDMFRGGIPVLRGRFVWNFKYSFRLWRKERAAKQFPDSEIVSAHKETQVRSSRLAGRGLRTFMNDHTPLPLRRSTLAGFEAENPTLWRNNVNHRLRSWLQFSAIALAAALELNRGSRAFARRSLVYICLTGQKNPTAYLDRKFASVDHKQVRYVCMQSLDQAPQVYRERMIAWVEARIFGSSLNKT